MALTLAGPPRIIAELGSEALRRKYLRAFCEEGRKVGIAISESEAGSAVTELRTRAQVKGSAVLVEGEKVLISHADVCAAFLTFVRFEDGIGAVVVDREAPGLEVGSPDVNMAGHRQYVLRFDACEIPADNVVVRGPHAFERLIQAFNAERCLSSMWAVSMALCALDCALDYARQRKQFGRRLAEFQGLQWMLADMAMKVEATRLLTYRAALDPTGMHSAMAKASAGVMVEQVTSDALQIVGGTGYMRKHPLEYLYRVARGRRIAAGTVEMQKNLIARELVRNGLQRGD
jgi:alkylation response protein AidB-like acyl-CoA dehydrogenase